MQIVELGQICKGRLKYEDGAEYEGGLFYAIPHGKGVLKNVEGHEYVGTFFHGKPHGHGAWISPKGKTIYGRWSESDEFEIMGEYENDEQR